MNHHLLSLVKDRRFREGSTLWVLAGLIVLNILVVFLQASMIRERQKNLLVTQPQTKKVICYDWSVGERLEEYWPQIPDARSNRLVILCGMSQVYVIGDEKKGDQTTVEWMDDLLSPRRIRVFGLLAPNLSNEEAVMLFLSCVSDQKTKPRSFIYGVCFDKFRNMDLRPGYLNFMSQRTELLSFWKRAAETGSSRYPLAAAKMRRTLESIEKSNVAKTETLEMRLRNQSARWIPLIALRKELNGQFQLMMYFLRHKILGISTTTKRPMIPERYKMSQEFLGLLDDLARQNGVQLLLYINPLNPEAKNPYVEQEYRDFKDWFFHFSSDRHIRMINLEGLVPSREWALTKEGPDFKHFKAEGHRILANTLVSEFGSDL